MLNRFFGRKNSAASTSLQVKRTFTNEGIAYSLDGETPIAWLSIPFEFDTHSELGALLAQLLEEGYVSLSAEQVMLSWSALYRLLDDSEYTNSLRILDLPPPSPIRPVLSNRGAITDPDFSIILAGWADDSNVTITPSPQITGAIAVMHGRQYLLSRQAWQAMLEIAAFHQRVQAERTPESNRRAWGRIRAKAIEAKGSLSDFLKKTVILTPEKLDLHLVKSGSQEAKTLEVIPTFKEAPTRWMEMFDRFSSVQDRYDIPDGEEIVQVIVSPEAKTVLNEIKRMPGRRVSGMRAEAFIRNPFSLLGPDASSVIDAEQFEHARLDADLVFQHFTPLVERDVEGKLTKVALLIEEDRIGGFSSEEYVFQNPSELDQFNKKLADRIAREAQCLVWNGYELEILGDTCQYLKQLQHIHDELTASDQHELLDIFDLSNYSARIEGIGNEQQYSSPFIARKNDETSWFPDNVIFGLQFLSPGQETPFTLPMDVEQIHQFESMVEDAKRTEKSDVVIPDYPHPISLVEAQGLIQAFRRAQEDISGGRFKSTEHKKLEPIERKHLVLKSNIDKVEYEEEHREELLALPPEAQPYLPSTLKQGVTLRDHQLHGVCWLQHLWRLSPMHCRGALLADDMGLGKTIQLLTFIAGVLEDNPEIKPILIVAPVALLENWKEEIGKFFTPGALPVLTLYGRDLAEKRLPKADFDRTLLDHGITSLLKKNWLGGAKVVLLTYETLRDLEFSLAAQPWSIMVCDEAQKIKNPNAMVTRAAKKQNVQFRIACTGTPVENTLTDLWCLFDFIQPGVLGSLSAFGRQYTKPIEEEDSESSARVEELRNIIRPQLLRREKKDVAKDLPAKIIADTCRQLPISARQRELYARAVSTLRKSNNENRSAHLGMLQYFRRLCSDPLIESEHQADIVSVKQILQDSPKMNWLMQELGRIKEHHEKVIVFCEFRDLQRTLQRCIATQFQVSPDIINGDTSSAADHAESRQKRIRAFQDKTGFGVIILSPLAVGFGVNIQAANHVIHFTRTWNPAKEDQATDRAYRIGQQKDVWVYYPIVTAHDFVTFDVKLDKLLEWRRSLSADMLHPGGDLNVSDFLDIQDVDGSQVFARF